MTSVFGWMDQDDAQRAAMNEIVQMFQDQGSVDELGIGPIRDAFSNSFFPGTSVLHTRVRYLLFIPWLVADAARSGRPAAHAAADLKRQEVRLIKALLAGGESAGVIGNRAQDRLKTMPSQTYWPALQRYGIIRWDRSIDAHLRRASENARRGTDVTDADAAHVRGPDLGHDLELPPSPPNVLTSTTFDLTPDEAGYLQSTFARLPEETLLHWFARRPEDAVGDGVWDSPAVDDLPDALSDRVDHARRFQHAWHGAPLLYNLMLAELVGDDTLVDDYRSQLDAWTAELEEHRVFDDWSQPGFWGLIGTLNPRLRSATQRFVGQWFEFARSGTHDTKSARDLISQREMVLKGQRSRLNVAQARESWSPGAGMSRLTFRWQVATSFLGDIRVGLDLSNEEGAA